MKDVLGKMGSAKEQASKIVNKVLKGEDKKAEEDTKEQASKIVNKML